MKFPCSHPRELCWKENAGLRDGQQHAREVDSAVDVATMLQGLLEGVRMRTGEAIWEV
jgi:hypothetical protein